MNVTLFTDDGVFVPERGSAEAGAVGAVLAGRGLRGGAAGARPLPRPRPAAATRGVPGDPGIPRPAPRPRGRRHGRDPGPRRPVHDPTQPAPARARRRLTVQCQTIKL